jgi:hypothetical protein
MKIVIAPDKFKGSRAADQVAAAIAAGRPADEAAWRAESGAALADLPPTARESFRLGPDKPR